MSIVYRQGCMRTEDLPVFGRLTSRILDCVPGAVGRHSTTQTAISSSRDFFLITLSGNRVTSRSTEAGSRGLQRSQSLPLLAEADRSSMSSVFAGPSLERRTYEAKNTGHTSSDPGHSGVTFRVMCATHFSVSETDLIERALFTGGIFGRTDCRAEIHERLAVNPHKRCIRLSTDAVQSREVS